MRNTGLAKTTNVWVENTLETNCGCCLAIDINVDTGKCEWNEAHVCDKVYAQ